MTAWSVNLARAWMRLGLRFFPFADAATPELPLGRLLRLSLFQVSVGIAVVLLTGTLNRVMIVELGVSATLVALMVSLPLVFAPARALIGHKSDTYRSFIGWRRVPFIWMGTLLQFGGLAIMPFALLVLSGDTHGPLLYGQLGAALAFLLVGAGMHTTQTAGLALATDLAPAHARPRVVALLYVMLLIGMVGASFGVGALLADFSQIRLIQVIQGAAVVTLALNLFALWKQEPRDPARSRAPRPPFRAAWQAFAANPGARRLLVTVGLGSAAFSMQDVLLEPYGGHIMQLSVAETTRLTAILVAGTLASFAAAAFALGRGANPHLLAAAGVLVGLPAFSAVIFAAPLDSALLFRCGTAGIGFGGGLFAVGTLTSVMNLARDGNSGIALGVWGAVHASATGLAIAAGGMLRDLIQGAANRGLLGEALARPEIGYSFVYHLEVLLLFVTLVAIGPLVRFGERPIPAGESGFGLADFPH